MPERSTSLSDRTQQPRLGPVSSRFKATPKRSFTQFFKTGQPSVFPTIALPTSSFKVGNALVGSPTYQTVVVQNNGQGVLYVGSIYEVSGTSEFSAPSSIPVILPSSTASFTVVLTPTSAGSKTATFRITSNDPNQPTIDFSISATAVPPGSGGIDFV